MRRDRLRRIYFGHPLRLDRRAAGRLLAWPAQENTQEASGTAREAPSAALSGAATRNIVRASLQRGLAEPPQVNEAPENKTAALSPMGGGMAEPVRAPIASPSFAVPRKLIDLSKAPSDMESRAAGWRGR